MDLQDLGKRLEYILKRVKIAAMRDGVITQDERDLIEITEKGIQQILGFIREKEKELEPEMKGRVEEILTKLEDDSVTIAELDDYISDDEIAILGTLFTGIDDLFSQ